MQLTRSQHPMVTAIYNPYQSYSPLMTSLFSYTTQWFRSLFHSFSVTVVKPISDMTTDAFTLDPNISLATQLDTVFDTLDTRLSVMCPDLVLMCRQLQTRTHRVILIAKQYDYKDTEANGYWTYVRLVIKFGRVALVSDVEQIRSHGIPLSIVLNTGLDLCEQFHSNSQMAGRVDLFATAPEEFPHLLSVFKSLTPQLDVIYGSYCSYWLCQSMRRVMNGFTTLMAIYSGTEFANWWQSSRSLWDRTHRAHIVAYIAQNATVDLVKSLWGLTEYSLVKNTLPVLSVRYAPEVMRHIHIPRQHKWRISAVSAEVIDCALLANGVAPECASNETKAKSAPTEGTVRCRLLQSAVQSGRESDSLVLHIHGGGFVAQSPDSHELYLRDWVNKLEGIPIVSVDYSLSPEAKYPTALQEVLDCYLWLTSGDLQVREMLGFNPTKVVVCGDSAGGNMSVALSLVLNDIRKAQKTTCSIGPTVLPLKAVLSFYAPLQLQTRGSPSRLMTAVDTLLPLGVLLSCLEAYAPDGDEQHTYPKQMNSLKADLSPMTASDVESDNQSFDFASLHFLQSDFDSDASTAPMDELDSDHELGKDFVHITYDDVPPDECIEPVVPHKNWSAKWLSSIAKIKRKLIGSDHRPVTTLNPWYRQSSELLELKLKRVNRACSISYVSPLHSSPDFDDVPLYLVALHYDACLDDSIEMAKKWKGPVVLDLLDELPHGFLNFVMLSDEGRKGSDLCLDRIKQALH